MNDASIVRESLMPPSVSRHLVAGLAAALLAVLIGAGSHVAIRMGVTSTLHPADLALLRFAFPALVLLPIALRVGLLPKSVPLGWLALLVIGCGFPFILLVNIGSQFAPVAHMGVIIPGGMALATALITWWLTGERYSPLRLIGFALLASAILFLGAGAFSGLTPSVLLGDLMFLAGAALWAGYTVAFRKTGLTPIGATALISVWSFLLAFPVWLLTPGAKLLQAPLWDLGVQFIWQSVLAGLVAVWAYGTAMKAIGPVNTAAIGALLPALSSLGGLLVLGEQIPALTAVATILAMGGVLLSTGYLEKDPDKQLRLG